MSEKKVFSIVKMVEEFHFMFGHPVLTKPQIPKNRHGLSYNLIKEELEEFKTARDNDDLVEVADALGDLLYVVAGAILEYGFGDYIVEIFEAIHKSNMTKGCDTLYEAAETQEHCAKVKGYLAYRKYEPTINKWLVHRVSDNKVVKSINYKPVDIKAILKKHGITG